MQKCKIYTQRNATKSAKLRHYSLSWQNSVKFCKDVTRDRIFYMNIVCMFLCCFFPSLTTHCTTHCTLLTAPHTPHCSLLTPRSVWTRRLLGAQRMRCLQSTLPLMYCRVVGSAPWYSVLLCADQCSYVQISAVMCRSVQLCADQCSYVQISAVMCRSVQLCADQCSYVQISAVMCSAM